MPSNHAILSPSSAKRWIACPGSALWERELPDTSGEAAAEGTLAHAIAEYRLSQLYDLPCDQNIVSLREDELYRPEMDKYLDRHIDYVVQEADNLMAEEGECGVRLEQRMEILPNCWGTSDVVLTGRNTLHIIDLKYGKGVPVSAEDNPQLMLYAWGAYRAASLWNEYSAVRMSIVQPRLDSISSVEMPLKRLESIVTTVFAPAAQAAIQPGQPLHAGEHCRFCRAAGRCSELARTRILSVAEAIRSGEREMTPEDLGGVLAALPEMEKWVKSVKEQAENNALAGKPPTGWKLVMGSGRRVIRDEHGAMMALAKAGCDPAQYTGLVGLTELEKRFGKTEIAKILAEVIVKGDGKPALVKEEDPRPAYSTAADDFKEE